MMALVAHKHFIPACLVAIYAAAAIRYAFARDWGRVAYWICAAGINLSATFGMGK